MTEQYSGPKTLLPNADYGDVAVSNDGQTLTVEGISGVALTASRAAVTDSSGNITTSATTATQVGYLSTTTSDVQTQISARALKLDIQIYEASTTWNKPSGAVYVEVICIGGGGGGSSGTKQASGTASSGGGGGAGAAISIKRFAASTLGSSETVTVSAGGTGGQSVTADNGNGNAGGNGGSSSFGTHVRAGGGNGAATYSTGAAPGGTAGGNALGTFPGATGRAGTVGDQGTSPTTASGKGCHGGGSGGGVAAAGPTAKVGSGWTTTTFPDAPYVTVTDPAVGGSPTNGQNGGLSMGCPGTGGASSVTGNAMSAGTTGKYGSGGSGGGSSINGSNKDSGAGGDGAQGLVAVLTWF